jgi:UPF0755 protein
MIRKVLNIFKLCFFGILVISLILVVWLFKSDFFDLNLKKESDILQIERGDTLRNIAEKLDVYEIYKKPFIAFLLMKLMISNGNTQVGEYEILNRDNILDVINKIKHKVHFYRKITFLEGETITRYKEQINEAYGLTGEITEKVSEGYFMPGTYKYLYNETKDSILKRGKHDLLTFVNTEFEKIPNRENFYLKNIHEVLSLASIVEKESSIGVERGLIAGVFYNRLQKKMKLQSDPTTIYEITKGRYKLNRPLTLNDLKVPGVYNTYYIQGIPIAPIASPGKDSIIAVLNPSKTDSLFFVANGSGGHNFAPDFNSHRSNIKKYKEALISNKETILKDPSIKIDVLDKNESLIK